MSVEKFNPKAVNINLTAAVLSHIHKTLSAHPEALGFRFATKKAGCSGLSYVAELAHEIHRHDVRLPNPDNLAIYVAEDSLEYLNGLTVDLIKKSLGQTQLTYINPNETGRCGCGESFSTKPGTRD